MRFTAIDYLLPVGVETPSMVIKKNGLENFTWLTYLKPFRTDLWYLLVFNCIFVVVSVRVMKSNYFASATPKGSFPEPKNHVAKDAWDILSSYFGGAGGDLHSQKRPSLGILLLVIFFSNNLVFMTYKASLTAELAVRKEKLPFSTLEDLFESHYRLINT